MGLGVGVGKFGTMGGGISIGSGADGVGEWGVQCWRLPRASWINSSILF